MAIYLTTGKPGSFKTASTIEHAQKTLADGRLVYFCNFRGLKAEENGFNVLEHFNEWESIPDGSVLYVDEVQEFTRDVKTAAKTEELPEWFTKLEKHRHRGIDIYLNTQHPMFIHTHIRRLVEKHMHLQRTEGLPFAMKRAWGQVCDQPEDIKNASIKMGCTTEMYRPNKSVFKLYESTVLDTHKFKFPTKLFKSAAILFGLIGFAVLIGYPVAKKYLNFGGDKEITQQQAAAQQPSSSDIEDRKKAESMGLTLEQYRDLMNPEKRNAELAQANPVDMDTIMVKYNPNKPYEPLPIELTYEVTAKPVFSGCFKKNGKYVAYSQQGTILPYVTQDDCKKLVEDGDRPFNYFAQQQLQQQIQNDLPSTGAYAPTQANQPSYQADNYVQPSLQQPRYGNNVASL